jgi:hypothetical protein
VAFDELMADSPFLTRALRALKGTFRTPYWHLASLPAGDYYAQMVR